LPRPVHAAQSPPAKTATTSACRMTGGREASGPDSSSAGGTQPSRDSSCRRPSAGVTTWTSHASSDVSRSRDGARL